MAAEELGLLEEFASLGALGGIAALAYLAGKKLLPNDDRFLRPLPDKTPDVFETGGELSRITEFGHLDLAPGSDGIRKRIYIKHIDWARQIQFGLNTLEGVARVQKRINDKIASDAVTGKGNEFGSGESESSGLSHPPPGDTVAIGAGATVTTDDLLKKLNREAASSDLPTVTPFEGDVRPTTRRNTPGRVEAGLTAQDEHRLWSFARQTQPISAYTYEDLTKQGKYIKDAYARWRLWKRNNPNADDITGLGMTLEKRANALYNRLNIPGAWAQDEEIGSIINLGRRVIDITSMPLRMIRGLFTTGRGRGDSHRPDDPRDDPEVTEDLKFFDLGMDQLEEILYPPDRPSQGFGLLPLEGSRHVPLHDIGGQGPGIVDFKAIHRTTTPPTIETGKKPKVRKRSSRNAIRKFLESILSKTSELHTVIGTLTEQTELQPARFYRNWMMLMRDALFDIAEASGTRRLTSEENDTIDALNMFLADNLELFAGLHNAVTDSGMNADWILTDASRSAEFGNDRPTIAGFGSIDPRFFSKDGIPFPRSAINKMKGQHRTPKKTKPVSPDIEEVAMDISTTPVRQVPPIILPSTPEDTPTTRVNIKPSKKAPKLTKSAIKEKKARPAVGMASRLSGVITVSDVGAQWMTDAFLNEQVLDFTEMRRKLMNSMRRVRTTPSDMEDIKSTLSTVRFKLKVLNKEAALRASGKSVQQTKGRKTKPKPKAKPKTKKKPIPTKVIDPFRDPDMYGGIYVAIDGHIPSDLKHEEFRASIMDFRSLSHIHKVIVDQIALFKKVLSLGVLSDDDRRRAMIILEEAVKLEKIYDNAIRKHGVIR